MGPGNSAAHMAGGADMSDDYTQTLWSVMARERVYSQPLEVEERRHLFGEWLDANPGAVAAMEGWALEIASRGEPVAVQRLFERMRWEGTRVEAVPYTDFNGRRHAHCSAGGSSPGTPKCA